MITFSRKTPFHDPRDVIVIFGKMTTTNVSHHDHDYTVDILFANDVDDDVQTLGKFSVENPTGHS